MTRDVFISYKREERAAIERIAERLTGLGLDVWFDTKLASGESFDEEINREVRAAKCVLVCWTPGAIQSDWVRAEASIGRGRDVLAAVFLKPTELYPPFNLVHAEDLSDWQGEDLHLGWLNTLARIGTLCERPDIVERARRFAATSGAKLVVDGGKSGRARKGGAMGWIAGMAALALLGAGGYAGWNYVLKPQHQVLSQPGPVEKAGWAQDLAAAGESPFKLRALWTKFLSDPRQFAPGIPPLTDKLTALERASWLEAQEGGSIPAYEFHLQKFPVTSDAREWPSAYGEEAQRAIAVLRGEKPAEAAAPVEADAGAAWAKVDQTKIADLKAFLGAFPNSAQAKSAQLQLDKLSASAPAAAQPPVASAPADTSFLARLTNPNPARLTPATLETVAARNGIEPAALRAFLQVQVGSRLEGFGADGRPIILFEPHLFSRLTQRRFDESHPTLSYKAWKEKPYPRSQAERWSQLEAAFALDPDAALSAASWGVCQQIGMSFLASGFKTARDFAAAMAQSEESQLEACLASGRSRGWIARLQAKDWEGVGRIFNGAGDAALVADRMEQAYARLTGATAQAPTPRPPEPEKVERPAATAGPLRRVTVRQTFFLDLAAASEGGARHIWFRANTATDRGLVASRGVSFARVGDWPKGCAAASYDITYLPLSENSRFTFCARTADGKTYGVGVEGGPGPSPGVLTVVVAAVG
jgi:hypothetical protein